jgi:hypothetical protein
MQDIQYSRARSGARQGDPEHHPCLYRIRRKMIWTLKWRSSSLLLLINILLIDFNNDGALGSGTRESEFKRLAWQMTILLFAGLDDIDFHQPRLGHSLDFFNS